MTEYAMPNVLVETQWLADHLDDPTVRIIEVDMSPESHKDAHIPGAIFWNFMVDLMQPNFQLNLDVSAMEALLSRAGITPQTTVVAYGSYPGTGGCIFWLLKLFGHEDVRVLNGSHRKWMAENRPVSGDLSTYAATDYSIKSPLDQSLRVDVPEVKTAASDADYVLLDVRSTAEFRGEQFLMKPPEGDERAGHIPGAVHIELDRTLTEAGTFKSFDVLKSLFLEYDVTPDKKIFPYCAVGARAGYAWFVLTYLLGYPNVRNYDGSWNEWSRLPETAVET
ncbi:MAG: sulfurtransferase [Cyanobacteria bacterium J06650_10]